MENEQYEVGFAGIQHNRDDHETYAIVLPYDLEGIWVFGGAFQGYVEVCLGGLGSIMSGFEGCVWDTSGTRLCLGGRADYFGSCFDGCWEDLLR